MTVADTRHGLITCDPICIDHDARRCLLLPVIRATAPKSRDRTQSRVLRHGPLNPEFGTRRQGVKVTVVMQHRNTGTHRHCGNKTVHVRPDRDAASSSRSIQHRRKFKVDRLNCLSYRPSKKALEGREMSIVTRASKHLHHHHIAGHRFAADEMLNGGTDRRITITKKLDPG